jgi:hypothetical protein
LKTYRLALVILLAGLALLPAGCNQAGRPAGGGPDVLALLGNLPVLTEENEWLESIEMSLLLPAQESGPQMGFHYCYRRPGQFSMSFGLGDTGLPLCIMAEGKTLILDPINRVVRVGQYTDPPKLSAFAKGDNFTLGVGGDANPSGRTIQVDMAALFKVFSNASPPLSVSPDPDGPPSSWIASAVGTNGKAGIVYRVGSDPFCPLRSFRLGDADDSGPHVSIRVNQPISDADLRLPDIAVLGRYVKLDQDESADIPAIMRELQGMLAGIWTALDKTPEARAAMEKFLGTKIDWDEVGAFREKFKQGMAEARRARVSGADTRANVPRQVR